MTNFEKVGLFMKTFGQEVKTKPSLSSEKINNLRISLINEELEEFKVAIKNNDLKEAIDALSIDKIVLCTATTAKALKQDFGISQPRIAVASLNPHAGEDGFLGKEEIEIIATAISQLQA